MRTRNLRVGEGISLAIEEHGDPALPAAALGHGAGSTPGYVASVFGPALAAAGYRLVTWHQRGHGRSTPVTDPTQLTADRYADDVAAVVADTGARLVGGISLGAHASARFAAGRPGPQHPDGVDGLLLAAPGWVGEPEQVAAANAIQAEELAAIGVPGALARVRSGAPAWLATLLEDWWPRHDPDALIAVLRTLAVSPGPGPLLREVAAPAGVVGLRGDPLHPPEVAAAWADLLPHAHLHPLDLDTVAAEPAALGRAAVDAWLRARDELVLSGFR